MIELEQQRSALLDPRCDAAQLTCLGVALGSAATAIAPARIIEVTFSPLVMSLSRSDGGTPQYSGFDKQPVAPDEVVASVVWSSGVLHTDADASFTIQAGRVARFSLYGRWLAEHAELDTLAKLVGAFGVPDRCLRLEADGDLIGYDSHYAASRKWVRWLASSKRPTAVLIGADADAVHAGKRGGISRTLERNGGSS